MGGKRGKGKKKYRVRYPGWEVTRPVAWDMGYRGGGGIMEGRRMEWRIGTGIYTQRDDDRAEIG